ncbi:hypothetical protein MBLNU230_g8600t1 [Neophaeotheca triangularis]
MAQPDINAILAQLSQLPVDYSYTRDTPLTSLRPDPQQASTSQAPTPQHGPPPHQPPPQQPPPGMYGGHMPMPAHSPSAGPAQGYLPPPSNTGSVDLSAVRPANTGTLNIQDAIARARSIAAENNISPEYANVYGHEAQARDSPRDPRLAGRGYGPPPARSRSRSPARQRDNYEGNPYREERRDDPRRAGGGGYRRSSTPDRNVRGSRDPPAGYRANDGETETIRVKSALVGLIIGRNGENLRRVETEAGARVQFLQPKASNTSERECTISGSTRARESAKTAIFNIIDENGGSNIPADKGAYTAGMPGRAKVNLPALREGEAQTQMMVPDKTVGLIIGRGGETIKDLQERSGCHVNIVGENKSVNGLRPVNLIGSAQATALAKELILEIVDSDSRNGSAGGGGGGGAPPGSNQAPPQRDRGYGDFNRSGSAGGGGGRDHVEKTIQVPSEAVGMIIGKGGETIKDMQRSSGCKINVNQPKPPDVTRDIDLAGSAQAMAEAERAIWDKVDTVRQRDAQGGGGRRQGGGRGQDQRGGGGGGYDGYSQQPQGYGQYGSPQQGGYGNVPPQMPAFQMPGMQQQQPQAPQQSTAEDPYAAYGGQQAVYAWYAQQMAQAQMQQQGQGQQPPGSGQ